MKKTIALLAFLLIAFCGTTHAKDGLQQFYAQHKADENVESIRLPKFLLALIPKDRETRAMLRCLKSIRILHMEALNGKRQAILQELGDAIAQDNFESLLEINDNGERANIYIVQDEKKIRSLLIMVDSDDELVLLQAKTKLSFEQLNHLLNDYKSGKDKSGLAKMISFKG